MFASGVDLMDGQNYLGRLALVTFAKDYFVKYNNWKQS